MYTAIHFTKKATEDQQKRIYNQDRVVWQKQRCAEPLRTRTGCVSEKQFAWELSLYLQCAYSSL